MEPIFLCTASALFRVLGACVILTIPAAAYSEEAPPPPEEAVSAAPARESAQLPPAPAGDTSQIIRDLQEQVKALRQRVDQLEKARETTTPPAEGLEGQPAAPPEASPESSLATSLSGGGRALLLPDISLIGTFMGHVSNDKRDAGRNRIFLEETELGIQGYVYPGVKADAFIVMPRDSEHSAAVEEAYLTALHAGRNLSLRVGKQKVPFGRTNQLHPHSWLYATQPAALRNLVAPESLTGQGAYASYLIPTQSKLFAQLDLGMWNSPEAPEFGDPTDAATIFSGSGAAFKDRFGTARLWTALPLRESVEVELGVSHARGRGARRPASGGEPDVRLTGADLSYRVYQGNNRRLLLRGEYIRNRSLLSSGGSTANGYYLLADQRLSAYRGLGLRYDWSQFADASHLHESSLSAIFTNQLTEQTYLRLQLSRGSRPYKSNFNEVWLEWVWGIGPHTHNLE